jgi:DNA polymerase-3 subunit epsilon
MLTGISNTMTDTAPEFADIADDVAELFAGATLIAHHARFDYSFIRAEMNRAGHQFECPQICTAKLSRALYSEYRTHNLSDIIERFGFTCEARHRAMGDTEVLVQLAHQIDNDFSQSTITNALERSQSRATLPPNVPKDTIDRLPHTPGVYSFYGKDGELLYVGKSIDIRGRVLSHFSNASRDSKSRRIFTEVYDVQYEETADDFSAQLLEIHKIKHDMPIYNRKLRRNERLWALTAKNDNGGNAIADDSAPVAFTLTPLDAELQQQPERVYAVYRTKRAAKTALDGLVKTHGLCPKLLGAESGKGACFSSQLGVCQGACTGRLSAKEYNQQVAKVFEKQRLRHWPYAGPREIIKRTPDMQRSERFVVDNWVLQSATILEEQAERAFFPTGELQFDYDVYKVLVKELLRA